MFSLGDYLKDLCNDSANHIADIAASDSEQTKRKKFLLLLSVLRTWTADVSTPLATFTHESLVTAHARLLSHLPTQYHGDAMFSRSTTIELVHSIHGTATARLLKVINGIRALADQVRQGALQILRAILGKHGRGDVVHDAASREKLAKRIIAVRGSDGRTRRYDPTHYGTMIQNEAEGKASEQVAFKVNEQLGSDIVQVSPQPSTINDYCNIYKGRFFSISGQDPRVYPLSVIPQGTCPMHPFCHHTLISVPPNMYSDAELRAGSRLPGPFVELGMSGKAKSADYQKLWLSKSPAEWGI